MPPIMCGSWARVGKRCGVSPVVMVTRRRQPVGSSAMVGKIAMSCRVTWPGTMGCDDACVKGCTGSNVAPEDVVQVRLGSKARWSPSSAPDDNGTLSPEGETASTVAASSVSVPLEVVYKVASIGPATTTGEPTGAVV